jgi:broad specificity phosphatase PhoE
VSLVPEGLDASLVLLRHGESELIVEGRFQGQSETPLSTAGRRQAALAAGRLARPHGSPTLPVPPGPPLEIVHSPLARTAQTATAVLDAMADGSGFGTAVPIRPDPGFAEIGQGEWEGMLAADVAERYGDVLATWRRRPLEAWAPGGEKLTDVDARVRSAVGRLLPPLAANRTPTTLDRSQVPGYRPDEMPDHPWSIVVGHDGVFKVLLLALLDLPLERFWAFPFALAGISVIEIRGGRATLRAHNLTEHLAPRLDERSQAVSDRRERSGAL